MRLTVAIACCIAAGTLAPGQASARWIVERLPVPAHAQVSYAEPGIAIGPQGRALVDAASANTGAPPTYWLSRDGGSSWGLGHDVAGAGLSTGDADAAIGADGHLYALNLGYNPSGQPANPTVMLYRSSDGDTWSGPTAFPPPHGEDQPDRPWLATDPRHPATVDVVNSEGSGSIVLWRSLDHGAHFAGPYPVTGGLNSQAALAFSSRPLFDPTTDGRMFMLYETAAPAGAVALLRAGPPLGEFPLTQLWLATSTDAGVTWSNRLVLDTADLPGALRGATLGHLLVASAIDPRGNLYAALSLRAAGGTRTELALLHSTDHGSTWSEPIEVPAPTNSNMMPAFAVAPDGTAYLSWYGSPAADFRDPGASWSELVATTAHPLSTHPNFDIENLSGATPVHVGGIDTAGTIGDDLGADWGLRDLQSIAVDACGRPHPVWASDRGVPATWTALPALSRC